MNIKLKYIALIAPLLLTIACEKEVAPTASKDLGIVQIFAPKAGEAPEVHKLYNDWGLWVRFDFNNYKEVTLAPLASDPNCRGVVKIADSDRASAIKYSETLMSNVSKEYSLKYFPLEFFYVNTYGTGYWTYNFSQIGRCRLVIEWPNKAKKTIAITNPEKHYYQDSVLTSTVWGYLGGMLASHIDPIKDFVLAGRAYDNGEAADNIGKQFDIDKDAVKRDAAYNELCEVGGYITYGGARSFQSDFGSWVKLLTTESYENIKLQYLDNSLARRNKYNILIKYFNDNKWDIQAAGNNFRKGYDEYKASLPPKVEEE